MNKTESLNIVTRIGLFVLILGLGLVIGASQAEQVALTDWFNRLAQAAVSALQDIGLFVVRQPISELLGVIGYVVLTGLIVSLYLAHFRPPTLNQARFSWLLVLLLLLFVGLAWVMIPDYSLFAYLFPMATLSIMLAVLVDAQLSILVTFLMGLTLGHIASDSLALTVYAVMGGIIGVLSMGRMKRLNQLLWSGAYIALSNVIVILIFHFSSGRFELIQLLELMVIGIANGVLVVSLTLTGFALVGNLLGITTVVQLLDLAQPTHPLLRRLLLHAPGTYHHSLMVGNLAEQAAERIGADAFLIRVGAYYHDVGKLQRPNFFIENQLLQKTDEHDQLDPQTSAQIIISHVKDGLDLAKKYRLPRDVRAFIAEHQGTGLVKSFYHQALKQTPDPTQVDKASFRYPGPKPQSKETAIVMLADSCEAAVRALQLTSVEELDQLVHDIIIDKVSSGQLDECDLTLRELELIHLTFVEMLQGVFHRRHVDYPQEELSQEELKEEPAAINPALLPTPSSSPVIVTPSTY
jgi:hypothetical protein